MRTTATQAPQVDAERNDTRVVRAIAVNGANASGAQESPQADGGADHADHDPDAEHDEGDVGGVAGGDEELTEEAVAVVERLIEAPVLERGHRDDRQTRAH